MSAPNLTKAKSVEILPVDPDDMDQMTFCQKFKYVIKNISVEPLILLLMVPAIMINLTTLNLNLEKACRVNLKYNSSVCDAMMMGDTSGYELHQEHETQKLVSTMTSIKMIVVGSYPTLLMLFVGSWSDRHGRRKLLIIVPIIGCLVGSICLYLCAYFFTELSVEWSMLAETIPFALSGTWTCFLLGVFTYVNDTCREENRTVRVGAVTLCQVIAMPVGMMISGFTINLLGFKGVYITCAVLLLIALVYGLIMIKDSNIPTENAEHKNTIKEFFSLEYVLTTFRICFKQDSNNRRSKMYVLLLLTVMIIGPIYGEFSVIYLYSRLKLGWDEVDFSVFSSIQSVLQILGGVFALSVFSKYLGCTDATLGIIASISKICGVLIYAFATTGLHLYIGASMELFHSSCHIAMRTILAKIVPPKELGQSSSVFGIFESLSPLIFAPIYTNLYNITIETFPGTFYILSSGLCLITLSLFIWMYLATKSNKLVEVEEHEENKLNDEQPVEEKTEKSSLDNKGEVC